MEKLQNKKDCNQNNEDLLSQDSPCCQIVNELPIIYTSEMQNIPYSINEEQFLKSPAFAELESIVSPYLEDQVANGSKVEWEEQVTCIEVIDESELLKGQKINENILYSSELNNANVAFQNVPSYATPTDTSIEDKFQIVDLANIETEFTKNTNNPMLSLAEIDKNEKELLNRSLKRKSKPKNSTIVIQEPPNEINTINIPKMSTHGHLMQSESAFTRLVSNESVKVCDKLCAIPKPGLYCIQNENRSKPTSKRRRRFKFSLIFVFLFILAESLLIGRVFYSRISCELIILYTTMTSAIGIIIIILEWTRAWLMVEDLPLLVEDDFRSTVQEANIGLEKSFMSLQSQNNGDQSAIFLGENVFSMNTPNVIIQRQMVPKYGGDLNVGGGFRGSRARKIFCDRQLVIVFFVLVLLYLLMLGMVLYGIYLSVAIGEICDVYEDNFVLTFTIIHSVLFSLRIVHLVSTHLCRRICKHVAKSKPNNDNFSVPMVTKQAVQLPDFRTSTNVDTDVHDDSRV